MVLARVIFKQNEGLTYSIISHNSSKLLFKVYNFREGKKEGRRGGWTDAIR